jgi:hypothetical protein
VVTKVPIACTLTADAAVDRLSEWKALLTTMVRSVETTTNHAALTLLGGSEPLLTATDLAEREKVCCSFFLFSIEMDGTETRLHIEVPPEADPILTDLLTLLPTYLRSN